MKNKIRALDILHKDNDVIMLEMRDVQEKKCISSLPKIALSLLFELQKNQFTFFIIGFYSMYQPEGFFLRERGVKYSG